MTSNSVTKYILYCAQHAGFQTRSILIPVDLLDDATREDLNKLREFAIKYKHEPTNEIIDNLLYINMISDSEMSGKWNLDINDQNKAELSSRFRDYAI